ncbi:TPA: hypothetical protein QHD00_005309 [Enterobacter cloacae subsp. cloacae]|nr:hypothetical protein [Leclercia sp. G3L]UGB04669.1 hypothetical protein LRS40_11810 [Leclercia sp. G3L]HDT6030502.1 hypothetical protein [Enterobacter cloacae subsp. cloacae]HDT6096801.1 hypothetical protein [Enterobacter cloacae subsp. cloacae]
MKFNFALVISGVLCLSGCVQERVIEHYHYELQKSPNAIVYANCFIFNKDNEKIPSESSIIDFDSWFVYKSGNSNLVIKTPPMEKTSKEGGYNYFGPNGIFISKTKTENGYLYFLNSALAVFCPFDVGSKKYKDPESFHTTVN